MQLFEYPSVRYWSKEINVRPWGPKINFLIRDIDDATMAAAPADPRERGVVFDGKV